MQIWSTSTSAGEHPLAWKSYLIRYWNKEVNTTNAIPNFLLSKASPLSAADSASFSKLAAQNVLSFHLPAFCASANLLCFPDLASNITSYRQDAIINYRPRFLYVKTYGNHKGSTATGDSVKKRVEPGTFFRVSMLKKGEVMAIPEMKDDMPKRSFLPRTMLSKLPLSTLELKKFFRVEDNSTMEAIIVKSLSECERAPSQSETKRCVGSAEDMIDFAVLVLGRNVAVRSTENVNGSKQNIMIGSVKEIDSGEEMQQAVSCHQSLFPYLLYYCHSVPNVQVYEVDMLDLNSKAKINHGVAICHMNTSDWSPSHEAFLALGSGPGRIEVCHWIYENDMTWTVAN
ncbi:polygalacturonase 1 beta-like protein 3 [Quercus suber]|uniref:Polygalacturonase 1 beta-like protein 3 n=1 Tax=Quercus suber TaxID=58331 RepID=A0AAW0JV46_QUESU|nr:polygalacturonase non-catalytic subunit AroGP2-like [Quercus suber]